MTIASKFFHKNHVVRNRDVPDPKLFRTLGCAYSPLPRQSQLLFGRRRTCMQSKPGLIIQRECQATSSHRKDDGTAGGVCIDANFAKRELIGVSMSRKGRCPCSSDGPQTRRKDPA